MDLRNDFGNDAMIQFVEGETVRAESIGAQIKSGDSYVQNGICKMPATRGHFELWSKSPFPIVGFVYDPGENMAYWTNITSTLKSDRGLIQEGPYTIRFQKKEINRFDESGFFDFFLPQFLNKPIVLDFERSRLFAQNQDSELHRIGVRSLLYGHREQQAAGEVV